MGYPLIGEEGSVVSWGSANFNATLLAAIAPMRWTMPASAVAHTSTAFAATTRRILNGLGEWTVDLSGYAFAAPRHGNAGNLSWSSGGYALHVESWEVNIEAPVYDITTYTAVRWRSFRPGTPSWTARVTAKVDSATAGPLPDIIAAAGTVTAFPTATFKYGEDTADQTLAGAAMVQSVTPSVAVGDVSRFDINLEGTGNLTPAGTSSAFGSSAFGIPLWAEGGAATGAIVLATDTGARTYTGEDSFWRRINLRCPVDGPVEINISVQGTGSLTAA